MQQYEVQQKADEYCEARGPPHFVKVLGPYDFKNANPRVIALAWEVVGLSDRLIGSIARKALTCGVGIRPHVRLPNRHLKIDDLAQEARIELFRSLPRYNRERAHINSFVYDVSVFAIARAYLQQEFEIGVPARIREKLREEKEQHSAEYRLLTHLLLQDHIPLSNYVRGSRENPVFDRTPELRVLPESTVTGTVISCMLDHLEPAERQLLELRLEDMNLEQVGRVQNISKQGAQQRERVILEKLRRLAA